MLVLTRDQTASLLDPDGLRSAVAAAMADVSAGRASMPQRIAAQIPERTAMLAAMPAYLPGVGGLAVKLVTLFPGNADTSLPTHHAAIVVFDASDGRPLALLDGTSITAARTAAGSALSVELLARQEARVLAILGTGVQARSHANAVVRVRAFTEVHIAGRDPAKVSALASELAEHLGVRVVAASGIASACEAADVICATTHSPDPIVRREHLRSGVHVTSVGYNTAGREVDSATIRDALVVVESRDAVLAPPPSGSNDLRIPVDEGALDSSRIIEIGELVAGTRPGRTSSEQITLYKSVGVAAQDVAAATMVLAAARAAGIGIDVEV